MNAEETRSVILHYLCHRAEKLKGTLLPREDQLYTLQAGTTDEQGSRNSLSVIGSPIDIVASMINAGSFFGYEVIQNVKSSTHERNAVLTPTQLNGEAEIYRAKNISIRSGTGQIKCEVLRIPRNVSFRALRGAEGFSEATKKARVRDYRTSTQKLFQA